MTWTIPSRMAPVQLVGHGGFDKLCTTATMSGRRTPALAKCSCGLRPAPRLIGKPAVGGARRRVRGASRCGGRGPAPKHRDRRRPGQALDGRAWSQAGRRGHPGHAASPTSRGVERRASRPRTAQPTTAGCCSASSCNSPQSRHPGGWAGSDGVEGGARKSKPRSTWCGRDQARPRPRRPGHPRPGADFARPCPRPGAAASRTSRRVPRRARARAAARTRSR